MLPEGVTLEWTDDRFAILEVLQDPRREERAAYGVVDITPEQAADNLLQATERWLARIHGRPIMIAYMKVESGVCLHGLYARADVEAHALAYTRCARAYLQTAVADYQHHRHLAGCLPGRAHRWLKLLGFRDTGEVIKFPGASVRVMEIVNTHNNNKIEPTINGSRTPNSPSLLGSVHGCGSDLAGHCSEPTEATDGSSSCRPATAGTEPAHGSHA